VNALLGTWKLKSYVVTDARGRQSTPYGEQPTVDLSYSADGRMQAIGAANGRVVPAGPASPEHEQVAL
jgi:Lipocalin-like domain